MSKVVATTFCKTLDNPTVLRLQIDKYGHVILRPYKDGPVKWVRAKVHKSALPPFVKILVSFKEGWILSKKGRILPNDVWAIKYTHLKIMPNNVRDGKRSYRCFMLLFDGLRTPIYLRRKSLLDELKWLEDKYRAYLRKAA